MTNPIRSFLKQVHHLPWVCAAIILVAGLLNWAMFSRQPAEPPPAPEPPRPAMFLDEDAFRRAMMPQDGQPSGLGQTPFGVEEAQNTVPGEPDRR